jgi:hypothetical protein
LMSFPPTNNIIIIIIHNIKQVSINRFLRIFCIIRLIIMCSQTPPGHQVRPNSVSFTLRKTMWPIIKRYKCTKCGQSMHLFYFSFSFLSSFIYNY